MGADGTLQDKPTVNDVARVAGVSLATVDRVLNARPGVRDVTIKKVQAAIETLGYVRDTAAANLARQRVYRFLFVLPDSENEFIDAIEDAVGDLSATIHNERTTLRITRSPVFDGERLVRTLDAIDPGAVDGIALFGPETPSVRDAVKRLKEQGVDVVTLVSDLPSSERTHFVGIDNVAAGRTAAQLIGGFCKSPGKVVVLSGSRLARDHLERRKGFDSKMAEAFPEFDVIASVEGRDDPERIAAILPRLFEAHPDIVGIYSSAAGNAGLIRFLEGASLRRDLVIVAHELTPMSRAALTAGRIDAIINQDAGHIVRSAVRLLRASADNVPFNPTQERIRIDIYLKDNMPALT